MSEGIIFPSVREQETVERRLAIRRILWILVGTLFVLALAEIVFQVYLMPRMIIRHVELQSDLRASREEVLSIAGVGGTQYYFSADTAEMRRRLEAYPVVREAAVEKIFPDTLRLIVRGREPLAVCIGLLGDRTVPVAFDAQGVIFQIGATVSALNMPVVSGLQFVPVMGLELPGMLRPLLEDMQRLKTRTPELFRLVSEIKVMAISDAAYELMLYPVGYPVRVNIGDRLDETFLRYVFMVLDVLAQQGITDRVREIDLRTGRVVYAESNTEG